MALGRRLLIGGMLVLLGLAPTLAPTRAQPIAAAETLLATWHESLRDQDHAAYLDCLHSAARQVPTIASPEAMAFWATELQELREKGFAGRYAIEPVAEGDARHPPGALHARPIVGGEPIDEALVIVPEDGRWTILRIFS